MRGTLRAVMTLATTGLVAGTAPAIGAAAPECRPSASPADEAALIGMINTQRRAEGVRAMATKPELQRAGRTKSMAMARGAAFAHSGALSFAGDRAAAQNIAMAPSAAQAFRAMLNSPPHRRNLLAKVYKLTGVGAARDCAGRMFFTINLMGPPPK